MDKKGLISQLENAKNNYILGLAAISLFAENQSHNHLEKSSATFGKYKVPFGKVANLLRSAKDRDIAIKEFIKSQLRTLIKESFELIKNYCKITRQDSKFENESWYQFARIIRNCLSHNFYFEFRNYDKSLLPLSWRGLTITLAMDGKPLKLKFFGYVQTWELFQEFQNFVLNRIQ